MSHPIHLRACFCCPKCFCVFEDSGTCPTCLASEVPGGDPVPVRLWRIGAPTRFGRQVTPPNWFGPGRA